MSVTVKLRQRSRKLGRPMKPPVDKPYATLVRVLRETMFPAFYAKDSRGALAKKLRVTVGTIDVWERGKQEPRPDLAEKLVKLATKAGIEVVTAFDEDKKTYDPSETSASDAEQARA